MNDTLTLVSHAGSRGRAPYGPTEHPVVAGATELVTWTLPDHYTSDPIVATLVEFEGRLWMRQPLAQALDDVEADGGLVRFDGVPPDDGSCHRPELHFDTEHNYLPFRSGIPLLSVTTERSLFGTAGQRAHLRFWEVESPDFPWAAVNSEHRSRTVRAPEGLPGPDHQRVLRTLFEFDQIPEAARAHPTVPRARMSVTIHDEAAARQHLDPAVILARLAERRKEDAEVVQLKLLAMAERVGQVIETGQAPEHYRQPSSGTETVYDPFAVSTRAVDDYLAASAVRDLFTRPAKEII
ncbi:hypothetical protein [Ornithinimicrobium murale]|uniref:hypothetical protein n=1 Tax=Ornithinimicrobium murale TaxID=1050153 RepID=UPI000E0DA155|nr:hypothetical protein [Ornithinimicrobium murale]